MRELRYREAVREAIAEEMEADERVFLMGEEVGHYQGAYKVSEGLLSQFGEKRVIDTPISESAIVGAAGGAALAGYRPVAELMFADFVGVSRTDRPLCPLTVDIRQRFTQRGSPSTFFVLQHTRPYHSFSNIRSSVSSVTPDTPMRTTLMRRLFWRQ